MISERLLEGWEFSRGGPGSAWEVWRRDQWKTQHDVPWTGVTLPHCHNAEDAVDPGLAYYQGPAWYRTRLDVANPYPDGRTLLRFEGAGPKTIVYVHDREAGRHEGGYDEFVVVLTEAIAAVRSNPLYAQGPVPLSVFCDNSRDRDLIPSDIADFHIYGGLYRYVNRVYVPAVSLAGVALSPVVERDGTGRLSIAAKLQSHRTVEAVRGRITVTDPNGTAVAEESFSRPVWEGEDTVASLALPSVRLWSPESPALYGVRIEIEAPAGSTALRERFGFRSFDFQKKGRFHLNGRHLPLRGTHRHEDHGGLGAAMPEDLIRREMEMIKVMGANFIRLGHYQQSRIVLDLCDELGLLVWEEIPWCRGGLGGERYREGARRMLRNMIAQHRNHPSVIFWGLGNEQDWPGDFAEFDKDAIRGFMRELHDLAHQLDPTRLTAIRRCGFAADIPDVYSPSIWAGWYSGKFTDFRKAAQNAFEKVDRMVHAEWGADSHAGRHSPNPYACLADLPRCERAEERAGDYLTHGGKKRASKDGDWSETYQCDLIDWHLKEQTTMDWYAGGAYWPFKDFATPVRPENPLPYVNQKGVVERDLTPKEAYFVFQAYWAKTPMVRVYGHSWKYRAGEGKGPAMIKVYSNCPRVECFLNGRSLGVRKRDPEDFPALGLRWSVPFRAGLNEIRAVARTDAGDTIEDAFTFHYDPEPPGPPHHLALRPLSCDEAGQAVIEATVRDALDRVCVETAIRLRAEVAGGAELLRNQGTVRGSAVLQTAGGRALFTLRRLRGPVAFAAHADDDLGTALRVFDPTDFAM